MMTTFHGIDFANKKANHGECWIVDDGQRLTASFAPPPGGAVVRTAVDCPFGLTIAFSRLLQGRVARNEAVDVFKSRATERLLRTVVSEYQVNRDWQSRPKEDREAHPRASFFNGSAHVQPAVGMVIVPELIAWLADRVGDDTEARLLELRLARLGEGAVIEAHPRLFLYSAIERLRRQQGERLSAELLDAVAGYKGPDTDAQARRMRVFEVLTADTTWLGPNRRVLHVPDVAALVATDHAFDAWLSAFTAWAHDHGQTWTWKDTAVLENRTVEVEGHILVLRIEA
jgi:hypothetical protein